MIDFSEARAKMVNNQVRTSDVTEHALISAMLTVPREEFVPEDQRALAYIDEDLSLEAMGAKNRFLMEPAPFAKLTQLASVKPQDVVLMVGAGSGYSSAVLSMLCSSVVAIEENEAMCKYAEHKLSELGYDNVAFVQAPLEEGCKSEAPFDVIFVDGAIDFVPNALLDQLQFNGRLVAVEGDGNSAIAKIYINDNGMITSRNVMNCAVRPLPGFQKEAGFTF